MYRGLKLSGLYVDRIEDIEEEDFIDRLEASSKAFEKAKEIDSLLSEIQEGLEALTGGIEDYEE